MDPIEAADTVLSSVWQDRGFPIDPVLIAGELGIKVMDAELPETISGALVKKENEDPIILLNMSDSKNRKRFTCAHEIGHYIDRKNCNNEKYEFIDLRGPKSSDGTNREEVFANKFAANLLMPTSEVRYLRKRGTELFAAAYYFGVSQEAYSNRLNHVGL